MSQDGKREDGNRDRNDSAPAKRRDDAKPLAEEVEEEMLDQDIPVETGVRPDNDKRKG